MPSTPQLHLTPEQEAMIHEGALPEHQSRLRQTLAATHPLHEQFAMAYENIGGVETLTDWAQDNQTEFYKMLARMAPTPKEIQIKDGRQERDITDHATASEAAMVYSAIVSHQ